MSLSLPNNWTATSLCGVELNTLLSSLATLVRTPEGREELTAQPQDCFAVVSQLLRENDGIVTKVLCLRILGNMCFDDQYRLRALSDMLHIDAATLMTDMHYADIIHSAAGVLVNMTCGSSEVVEAISLETNVINALLNTMCANTVKIDTRIFASMSLVNCSISEIVCERISLRVCDIFSKCFEQDEIRVSVISLLQAVVLAHNTCTLSSRTTTLRYLCQRALTVSDNEVIAALEVLARTPKIATLLVENYCVADVLKAAFDTASLVSSQTLLLLAHWMSNEIIAWHILTQHTQSIDNLSSMFAALTLDVERRKLVLMALANLSTSLRCASALFEHHHTYIDLLHTITEPFLLPIIIAAIRNLALYLPPPLKHQLVIRGGSRRIASALRDQDNEDKQSNVMNENSLGRDHMRTSCAATIRHLCLESPDTATIIFEHSPDLITLLVDMFVSAQSDHVRFESCRALCMISRSTSAMKVLMQHTQWCAIVTIMAESPHSIVRGECINFLSNAVIEFDVNTQVCELESALNTLSTSELTETCRAQLVIVRAQVEALSSRVQKCPNFTMPGVDGENSRRDSLKSRPT